MNFKSDKFILSLKLLLCAFVVVTTAVISHQVKLELNPQDLQIKLLKNDQIIKLDKGWYIFFDDCNLKACQKHENSKIDNFTSEGTKQIFDEILDEMVKQGAKYFPYIIMKRPLSDTEIAWLKGNKKAYLVAPLVEHSETKIYGKDAAVKETYLEKETRISHKIEPFDSLDSENPLLTISFAVHKDRNYFGPVRWPFAIASTIEAANAYSDLPQSEVTYIKVGYLMLALVTAILLLLFLAIDNRQVYKAFIAHLVSNVIHVFSLFMIFQLQDSLPMGWLIVLIYLTVISGVMTAITLSWFAAAFAGLVRTALPPLFLISACIAVLMYLLHMSLEIDGIWVLFRDWSAVLNIASCIGGIMALATGAIKHGRSKRSIEERIADEEVDRKSFVISAAFAAFGLGCQAYAAAELLIAVWSGADRDVDNILHLTAILVFIFAIALRIGSFKKILADFAAKQTKLIRTQLDFSYFVARIQESNLTLQTEIQQNQFNVKIMLIMALYLIRREISAFAHAQFKLLLPDNFLRLSNIKKSYITKIPHAHEDLDNYILYQGLAIDIDNFMTPLAIYDTDESSDWLVVFAMAIEHYQKYLSKPKEHLNDLRLGLEREHQVLLLEERGLDFGMIHIDNIRLQEAMRHAMSEAELNFFRNILSTLSIAIYRHIHSSHIKRIIPTTKLAAAGITDIAQIATANVVERNFATMSVDIRNFTTLSESLKDIPQGVHLLRKLYSETMADIYNPKISWLEAWVGDGAWYAFNEADEVIRSAFKLFDQMPAFNQALRKHEILGPWAKKLEGQIVVGVAAHYGAVSLGNAGDRNLYNFTILSDSVNTTSRIEGLTKNIPDSLVISEDLLQQLSSEMAKCIETIDLGSFTFKGKSVPTRCHRVVRKAGHEANAVLKSAGSF